MSAAVIGFGNNSPTAPGKQALERMFSPEFRNRLDAIINFNPLPEPVILMVVDKFILALETKLQHKKVVISISDETRSWLGEKGYDPKFGARLMQRVIQQEIETILADEVLFGQLINGGQVFIDVKKDSLPFEYSENE